MRVRLWEILAISFKNILRSPKALLLPASAVAIGIASVILISSVGNGAVLAATAKLNELGVDGLCLDVDKGKFAPEDAAAIAENVEGVQAALPFTYTKGTASAHQRRKSVMVFGTGPRLSEVLGVRLLHGRDITAEDVRGNSRVIIVGEEFAQAAYERTNIVGKTVKLVINGIRSDFTVVGVMVSQTESFSALLGASIDSIIYVPYSTSNELSSASGLESIAVKLEDGADSSALSKDILKYIRTLRPENTGYSIKNISSYLAKVRELMDIIALMVTAAGSISLIVAGIGVMNGMLAGIDRRKREIGLYMAIGAMTSHIRQDILAQSTIICGSGGIIGLAAGLFIGYGLRLTAGLPFAPRLEVIAAVEAAALVFGVLFGVVPALRAARLEPVDALRDL